MRIKIDQWQLMQAIEEYLNNKDINFDLTNTYTEMYAQVTENIRQHKKHKNGKVVKNEYGHPEWETVGQETKSVHIKEDDEIEIFIDC